MSATAMMVPASPQYMRALERANKVRLARAELKRGVAHGDIDVAAVILECPWEAESMAIADLLTSQRRWGQTRVRKLLASVPLSETKTVGSMTERQRRTLAAMLVTAQTGASRPRERWTVERRNGVPPAVERRNGVPHATAAAVAVGA